MCVIKIKPGSEEDGHTKVHDHENQERCKRNWGRKARRGIEYEVMNNQTGIRGRDVTDILSGDQYDLVTAWGKWKEEMIHWHFKNTTQAIMCQEVQLNQVNLFDSVSSLVNW